jgi:DNA (cytosine-5)-methyltransferase 1
VSKKSHIPVIDLFAGPGGLGEGFTALKRGDGSRPFRVSLSIEKSEFAHSTLLLRSFVRRFGDSPPEAYYRSLRQTDQPLRSRLEALFAAHPNQAAHAQSEAWHAELGSEDPVLVRQRISASIAGAKAWVLLGGPPCQAYSVAGRSRNKGNPGYRADHDKRQFLYVEYLHVIAEHQPAVFVMENVKGLLSARVRSNHIFERIVEDLKAPVEALRRDGRAPQVQLAGLHAPRYQVFSIVESGQSGEGAEKFLVQMEKFGIPQARHRLILLGVRTDVLGSIRPHVLVPREEIPARLVLDGLPALRSGLSREQDDSSAWLAHLRAASQTRWFSASANRNGEAVHHRMLTALYHLAVPRNDRGGEFVSCRPGAAYAADWYLDPRLGGVLNHRTREHMVKDLHRYLYCAAFGYANHRSPVLADFPRDLLPEHRNVEDAIVGGNFDDRFRVQLADRPSTTVTSHIAKDGHYYIHPDARQCRTLTVREAARLQTFPDNYFFCGPRTAQYAQVGNAVPPLLARQIGEIVFDLLRDTGITE